MGGEAGVGWGRWTVECRVEQLAGWRRLPAGHTYRGKPEKGGAGRGQSGPPGAGTTITQSAVPQSPFSLYSQRDDGFALSFRSAPRHIVRPPARVVLCLPPRLRVRFSRIARFNGKEERERCRTSPHHHQILESCPLEFLVVGNGETSGEFFHYSFSSSLSLYIYIYPFVSFNSRILDGKETRGNLSRRRLHV